MNYKKIISRLLDQNIYILSNDKNEAIIIDPGLGFDLIDDYLKKNEGNHKSIKIQTTIKGMGTYQRLFIQSILAIYIVLTTGVQINSLGNLFGFGEVNLGKFSVPFTIFCVAGIMNAFNMMDGINGLCSGCAMLSLLLIGFILG